VARFEPLRHGAIRADGELLSGPGVHQPPERRRIGMVFQDHALLPHLSALDNVRFGLFALARGEAVSRAMRMLELVGLADLAGRYPHELSGGQQQRIALARALAPQPRMVLFDEPFASLDPDLRERLARDVRAALKATGTSALLVTHTQAEAFAMADLVGLVGEGRLHQWAAPEVLYRQPATRFVAGFVGEGVLLRGNVIAPGRARCVLGDVALKDPALAAGYAVDLLVRPANVRLVPQGGHAAALVERRFRGADALCVVRLDDGTTLKASLAGDDVPGEGTAVALELVGPVAAIPVQH
jgi:iron(III) transport system ATP-binding protein